MEQKLVEAFHKIKYEPDASLAENVWRTIILRNKHTVQLKLWAFAATGIASLIGLVPAFKILSNDLAQSGFYEYFSLIFSNGGSILFYWKELVFSLAESLPTMSIILTLSLIFILILSLKNLTKQIINNNPLGKTYGVA